MTIEKAKALLELGDVDQARQLLLTMARSNTSDVAAWLLLCGISMRTEDWNLGIESFENLSALRPTNSLASSGLVQSYYKSGLYEDARKEIKRFQECADSNREDVKVVLNEHQKIANEIKNKK